MLKSRIILVIACIVLVVLLFNLPKVVVRNEDQGMPADSTTSPIRDPHAQPSATIQKEISRLRSLFTRTGTGEKSAIFADSLADLYWEAGKFDSAAWFADQAATFFKTMDSWKKAGDSYYQAFTFEMDQAKQNEFAQKAQQYFSEVLKRNASDLEVKNKLAMTYITTANPMQGISLLREVLAADPKNQLALFNLGMLSIQSGQYERAIDRLKELIEVNPNHVQGQLLLGVAYKNSGKNDLAREQFEKVKQLDADPAVQATADSYLKDLK